MLAPDIGHVYPKGDVDIRFDSTPRFVSEGSMYLDGADDYLDLDGLTLTTSSANYSFSFWFKSQDGTADHRFFGIIDNTTNDRLNLYMDATTISSYSFVSAGGTVTTFSTSFVAGFEDGTWHHAAMVITSGTGVVLYLDGQLVTASQTMRNVDLSNAGLFKLGGGNDGTNTIAGNICHFGVWHAALTQAQIRSLMTATTYAEAITKGGSTPRAYYLLEADADDSASVQDGTFTNGAVIVGDRARLPSGYDLSMTDGVPNQMNAQLFSGRAIALDGTGDYVKLDGFNFDSTAAWTVESWMKLETPSAERFWFAIGDANEVVFYYSAGAGGDIGWYPDGAGDDYGSALPFCDGATWHHWCLSVGAGAGGTDVLYIDGKQYATSTATVRDISAEPRFHFAADCNGNFSLDGSITGIKVVVGTAYTAAQALEAYKVPEQPVPSGVTSSHLKCWLGCDYDISGADNLGGLYLQDASGNGNHGLMVNGTAEFSQPNISQLGLRSSSSRIFFDGTDDYVNLGHPAISQMASGDFSIACWVFPMGSALGFILSKTDGGGDSYRGYRIGFTADGYSRFRISDGTTQIEVSGSTDLTGGWHHFAATVDRSGNAVVYIDGSAESTTDITGVNNAIEPSTDLVLGTGFGSSPAYYLSGIIDQAAIYKGTVLDAPAVAAMHAGGRGFDLLTDSGDYDYASDLDGWWRVDNPVTIQDLTANDNDGTVSGTPAMATVPEGTTEGLSVMGSLTTTRLGSGVLTLPPVGSMTGVLGGMAEMRQPAFGTQNFTIACWARCDAYLSGYPYLFNFAAGSNEYGVKAFVVNAGGAIQWTYEGATTSQTGSGTAGGVGKWTFTVFQRLGAASFKLKARLIDSASWAFTTSKTVDVGDMTEAGPGYWGNYGASNSLCGPLAFPRVYLHGSDAAWTEDELDAIFEQGKRFLLGDS